MTLEEAREIARNPNGLPLSRLVGALAALGREVDRRDTLELEQAKLRAHAMRSERHQRHYGPPKGDVA